MSSQPVLQPAQPPIFVTLPNTEYFEIDSAVVGRRFAVWVTVPNYFDPNRAYPILYVPDGNLAAALTAPILVMDDFIQPKQPYIQVSVGYPPSEIANIFLLRNFDLIPPGEPASPVTLAMIDGAVASGAAPKEFGDAMKASLQNARADLFLSFLADELHPQIAAKFKVDESACGLFAFSMGGLFSIYVALQRHPLFKRIGAGSPGILTPQSVVFEMAEKAARDGADYTGHHLHLSANELEITTPGYYQATLGPNFGRFLSTLSGSPIKGLTVSSQIIPNETHSTGPTAAFASFIRTLYAAK